MQDTSPDSLLSSLDHSLDMFCRLRTSDPVSTAAFDTLKQARAMIARALAAEKNAVTRGALMASAG